MTPKGYTKRARIIKKGGIDFYRNILEITHSSVIFHIEDKAYPTLQARKHGVKNDTGTGKQRFLSIIWDDIITILELYPDTLYNPLVNTVWVDNSITEIMYLKRIKTLR